MGTGQAYTPLRERLHTLLLVSTVGAGALVLFFLRLSAEAGHQIHPSRTWRRAWRPPSTRSPRSSAR